MTRNNKILAMKSVCWAGCAADALWTVALAWPELYGVLTGQTRVDIDLEWRLILGVAASLMAGWTSLLAWAAQDPVERRMVMALTAMPVLIGLIAVAVTGIVFGDSGALWILIKCCLLFTAMAWGWMTARGIAREKVR
ncbi:MAG: hypothetical protein D3926_19355 [Desulfobacteraceae bacterium]|nr:MAG: hypothetical protein D3926_19355 [Desulfobacteraceae bacterium]